MISSKMSYIGNTLIVSLLIHAEGSLLLVCDYGCCPKKVFWRFRGVALSILHYDFYMVLNGKEATH